ncbi:MAG: hypothetical protein AAGE94_24335 [Acidobacteriota bacterium]
MSGAEDHRIRALRPPRPPVDPWRPIGWEQEVEIRDGVEERALTVFLAGAECAFTCVFCDLWRYTTETPTPIGAIPEQLRIALDEVSRRHPEQPRRPDTIKLYNASNFFDRRAVPLEDDTAILDRVAGIGRVVVECHPMLVARRAF